MILRTYSKMVILIFKILFTGKYIEGSIRNLILTKHGRKCLAVVLVTMLEQELSDFVAYWNLHRIRSNRIIECPTGIPEDMFDMPEEFGKQMIYIMHVMHGYCCIHVHLLLWLFTFPVVLELCDRRPARPASLFLYLAPPRA